MLPGIAKRRLEAIRAERAANDVSKAISVGSCESFFRDTLGLDKRPEPLSLAQWVFVRVVFDRIDPTDLETETEREIAGEIFESTDRFPNEARHVVAMLKGARVGGTWLWSLFLLYRALTADLSRLAAGEVGFAPIVAERLDLGYQSINYIKGAIVEAGLRSLQINDATESVSIRRPSDGRIATIKCFAASKGGSAVRGKSFFAALMDEACFFRSKDTGVVNDVEIFRAISPRVMAGGMLGIVSTVWAESGLLWNLVQENLGKPDTAVACIAKTLVMRDDEKIRADYRIALQNDPENAAREFDCVPLSTDVGSFFDGKDINAAIVTDYALGEPPASRHIVVGSGVDTGLVKDRSACVIVHRDQDDEYRLAEEEELKPPLKLSFVCETYSKILVKHGKRSAIADHHELEASREHMQKHGCDLEPCPSGNQGKLDTYSAAREIFRERRIKIHADCERLIAQLREVMAKPIPGGGVKIWSPRNKSGHGDVVSAFVNAVWDASQNGTAPKVPPKKPSARSRWGKNTRSRGF